MADLEEIRKSCGDWEEDCGCLEDYPDECPLAKSCREDALGDKD